MSRADLSEFTRDGITRIGDVTQAHMNRAGVTHSRTAVFSPTDTEFGISRMYEVFSSGSPEETRVFRDRDEAIRWLET